MRTSLILIICFIVTSCTVNRNKEVKVIGIADNAKLGAIVISKLDDKTYENDVFYLDNIEYWPEKIEGKKVEVTGFVETTYYKTDENAPFLNDFEGEKKTILQPKWRVLLA